LIVKERAQGSCGELLAAKRPVLKEARIIGASGPVSTVCQN
jgi:hypothetical protein